MGVKHRGRPMTAEEKKNCRIPRKHKCKYCGRIHYIGRDEELQAWECITNTSHGFYITQCDYCGALMIVNARGEDFGEMEKE